MTRPRRRLAPQEQRHVAERPLFEFDIMDEQQMEQVQRNIAKHGLILGIKEPKREKKFKRKPMFVGTEDIQGKTWKKILANKWLPMHPVKLAGEVVSTKKGGWWKFRRDRRNAAKIKKLNEKYAPAVEQINNEYKAEVERALQELIDAVDNGRVNKRNRKYYFSKYQQQVQAAEIKFMNATQAIIEKYGKEFTGKWV